MYAFTISLWTVGVKKVELVLHLMAQPPWDSKLQARGWALLGGVEGPRVGAVVGRRALGRAWGGFGGPRAAAPSLAAGGRRAAEASRGPNPAPARALQPWNLHLPHPTAPQ
jgi:hypothetical protein